MPALERNGRWKGGEWVTSKGYVMVRVGREHPMANCRAYAPRGRVVCYDVHGAPLPGQHVHHKDGDKQNDTPDNLEWAWPSAHGRHHLTPERARKIGAKGGRKAARLRRRRIRANERLERAAARRRRAILNQSRRAA